MSKPLVHLLIGCQEVGWDHITWAKRWPASAAIRYHSAALRTIDKAHIHTPDRPSLQACRFQSKIRDPRSWFLEASGRMGEDVIETSRVGGTSGKGPRSERFPVCCPQLSPEGNSHVIRRGQLNVAFKVISGRAHVRDRQALQRLSL
jgi:hypothetical protein